MIDLLEMLISKTYKDVITEPREKNCNIERRWSVLERRSSIATCIGENNNNRRKVGVAVPTAIQENMEKMLSHQKKIERNVKVMCKRKEYSSLTQ